MLLPFRRWILLLALSPAVPLLAQTHAPLPVNEALDFPTLLEHSLQQAPLLREDPVRRREAEAWLTAGRGWLAGPPSLSLNYFDDRPLDDQGQRELEFGVQLPLWRPGERADASELGRRYQEQLPLWLQALSLELAGELRGVLADIAEASAVLDLEREATRNAEALVDTTRILYEAGQLARLDLLQAETQLLEQRQREYSAEAVLVAAEISYRQLTGLAERPPAPPVEQRHPAESVAEVEASHPLLRYLQGEVGVAGARLQQERLAALGSPQLGIGARRDRGDRFSPYTDSINLSLQLPIGGRSLVDARSSGALREQVAAEVIWLQTRRELERALHEAEHELDSVERSLPLAEAQAQLAEERRAMAELAFTEGEIDMTRLLPALLEARNARQTLVLLRLREQRLIATYNQVLGVLP